MSVHYKFKSALDFDTITFDGLHISVSDLKKAIVHQKRLGKTGDFDLQITNAQTKEEYSDENSLIPKNTSLIIARIPLVVSHRKTWDPTEKVQNNRVLPEIEPSQIDLSRMNGSEEDKIKAMMAQSTMDYDPTNYQKIRGSNQTGEVPLNYRCFKCHKPGHWIKHCPFGGVTVKTYKDVEKRNTGIPRSFLEGGQQAVANTATQVAPPPVNDKTEIPEDLICGICKSLFVDAVMIPCCGSSFCDECVRTALLESEDNECPDCKEKGTSPGSLIPNRFLRNSVNSFKNETGYSKPRPTPRQKVEELAKNEELLQKAEDPGDNIDQAAKEIKEDMEQISHSKEDKSKDEDDSSSSSSSSSSSDDDTNSDENESDYEDNITVTVPPAHLTSHGAYKERSYIGRHSHRLKPPGLDTPPKSHQHYQNSIQDERSATPTVDEKETYNTIPSTEHTRPSSGHLTGQSSQQSSQQTHPQSQQQQSQPQQQHSNHPSHSNMPPSHQQHDTVNAMSNQSQNGYGGPPNQMHYQQQHQVRYEGPEYQNAMHGGNYPPRPYDPMGGQYRHERPRQPYMQPRMPYPPMQNQMMRGQRHPLINDERYAQVYEGVQAKVGTGVIDDPLEVFNRIMREKERRKEEHRRRSPHMEHGRRSRSHDMDRRRPSMERRRTSRLRSPIERRGRSPEDRRGRSHVRESADRKRRRSSSFSHSSRSSRTYSRSRSPPMRKRSRTPAMRKRSRSMNRRSRSRSQSFSMNRFNNRYRDNPRGGRGDGNRGDFGEFRDRSPFYNRGGRGGFRGRGRGHQMQFRQDRQQQHNIYKEENNFGPQMSNYHESGGQYGSQNANRFNQRDQPPMGRGQQQGYAPQLASLKQDPTYDNEMGYRDRFDEGGPPGMEHEQPLPPGFEGERYEREGSYNSQQHYLNDYHRNNEGGDNNYPNNERNEREGPRDRERDRERERDRDRERPPSRHEPSRTRSPPIERGHHDIHRRHSKSKSKDRHESRKDKQRREETSKKVTENVSSRDKEKNLESSKKRIENTTDDEKREKKISKEKKKKKKEGDKKKNKKDKKEKRRESEKEKKNSEKSSKRNKDEREMFDIPNEQHIEKEMFTPPPQPILQSEETKQQVQNDGDDFYFNSDKDVALPKSTIAEVFEQDMNEPDLQNEMTSDSQKESPAPQFTTNDEKLSPHNSSANSVNSPLNHLKHSDSILDIHANLDFDNEMIDLDDSIIKPQNNGEPSVLVPLPEPSKWERDEDSGVASEKKLTPTNETPDAESDERSGKVTNEVLKRAENAIFARAINAIRPIEIKKISLERQKLYSNDKNNIISDDGNPVTSIVIRASSPIKETFQITVPVNNRHSGERSVEIKTNVGDMPKPLKMSIKDRLGSKLTKSRSRTKSPSVQRVQIEISNNIVRRSSPSPAVNQPTTTTSASSSRTRREREREERPSRSRDDRRNQNNSNNSNTEHRSGSGNYRSKDRKYSKDREQQQVQQQQHQNMRRDGGHDRNNQRNQDARGSRDQQIRNRDRFNEKGRERRSRSKPKENEKGKDKPTSASRRRSPEKRSRTPDKRDRNKDRTKTDQQSSSSRNDDKKSNKKRSRSTSGTADRKKDKRNRKDEKENQNSGDNSTKDKTDRNEKNGDKKSDKTPIVRITAGEKDSSNKTDRKRTTIDEANFVPDYEQMDQEQHDKSLESGKQGKSSNSNNNSEQNVDRKTQIQKQESELGTNRHRHRSPSSEQSSSSTDSDSSAETDESSHRRKKRKHKKQKKSKKAQPSSTETDESPRKKKKKDKKSKSSKKKKKSKHK